MTINAKPTQLLDIDDVWGGWSEVRYKNVLNSVACRTFPNY